MLLIYCFAWVLRYIFVLNLRGSPLADVPVLDELYHVEWARALAAGDWIGSEVFFRAPLYPYLLGVAFALFKGSLAAARVIQVTYSALTPVAVYLLARRLLTRERALVAGCVAAAYPFLIYFTNELLIESLVVVLDAFALLAVVRADEVPSWGRWVGAGAVMGLSAIARPSVLVVIPFVLAWIWWRAARTSGGEGGPTLGGDRVLERGRAVTLVTSSSPLRTTAARFALFIVGVGIVVSPVTLRNYALGRDFVPIASQGGINFFIGNNAQSDGVSAVVPMLGEAWEYEGCVRIAERAEGRALKPSEVSDYWYRKGVAFALGNPGAAARLLLRKFVLFWNRFELANNKDIYFFANMSPLYKAVSWLSFGLVVPFAVLGAVVSRRDRVSVLMSLFVLSYMAGVIAFFVNARFRLPVVPFLIVFAVAGLFWLIERVRTRDVRRFVWGAALVAVVAVGSNADFYGTHVGDRPQTHNTIGLALASKGRHEEALVEFRRAIELSPGYAKAMNNMGLSLEALGRDAEAAAAYTSAIEKDATLASARNNLGGMARRRGDLASAAKWFAEAIRLDPEMREAHANLAGVLAAEGDLRGAEQHYRAAVVADPRFKEAWVALGVLLEETGRPAEAIAAYTRAIDIDPAYAMARNNLGIALAGTGQYAEALKEFRLALEAAPGDAGIAGNIELVEQLIRTRGVTSTSPKPPSP
jgi:tetratricopeptide (TPR) repeat protein